MIGLTVAALTLSTPSGRAEAQETTPGQREALGRIIAAGVVLSSTDFVGGGSFDIEGGHLHSEEGSSSSLRISHIPWRHWFGGGRGKYRPWVLGALGRVVIRQPVELLGEPADRSRYESDSLAAVAGLEMDLGSGGWYAEPSLGVIYSRIESDLTYKSPESETLRDLLDGVFFNWTADAITWTGGLRLGHRTEWPSGMALDLAGQAIGLWTNPTSTDSPVQDTSTSSYYARLQARWRVPTGRQAFGWDVYVVPRAAHTFLSESIEEPLASDAMTELNLRLMTEARETPSSTTGWWRYAPRAVGFSVSHTRADAFEGWSFGITFHSWSSGW